MTTTIEQALFMPYKCGGIDVSFYSNSCDAYVKVWLDDIPYCVSSIPHPTCLNYHSYGIEFEVRDMSIQSIETSSEFVPSDWKEQIANEVNQYLAIQLDQNPDLKNKLIMQELELCLA